MSSLYVGALTFSMTTFTIIYSSLTKYTTSKTYYARVSSQTTSSVYTISFIISANATSQSVSFPWSALGSTVPTTPRVIRVYSDSYISVSAGACPVAVHTMFTDSNNVLYALASATVAGGAPIVYATVMATAQSYLTALGSTGLYAKATNTNDNIVTTLPTLPLGSTPMSLTTGYSYYPYLCELFLTGYSGKSLMMSVPTSFNLTSTAWPTGAYYTPTLLVSTSSIAAVASGNGVQVTWNAISGWNSAQFYRVYYCSSDILASSYAGTATAVSYATLASSTAAPTAFFVGDAGSELAPTMKYYVNLYYATSLSGTFTALATTRAACTTAAAATVTGFQCTSVTDKSCVANWTSVENSNSANMFKLYTSSTPFSSSATNFSNFGMQTLSTLTGPVTVTTFPAWADVTTRAMYVGLFLAYTSSSTTHFLLASSTVTLVRPPLTITAAQIGGSVAYSLSVVPSIVSGSYSYRVYASASPLGTAIPTTTASFAIVTSGGTGSIGTKPGSSIAITLPNAGSTLYLGAYYTLSSGGGSTLYQLASASVLMQAPLRYVFTHTQSFTSITWLLTAPSSRIASIPDYVKITAADGSTSGWIKCEALAGSGASPICNFSGLVPSKAYTYAVESDYYGVTSQVVKTYGGVDVDLQTVEQGTSYMVIALTLPQVTKNTALKIAAGGKEVTITSPFTQPWVASASLTDLAPGTTYAVTISEARAALTEADTERFVLML
ncbi:hypothetical protein JKP88DRAFT_255168 [Tribonema minus]|uniref:Uncharacterized protein n=1 Tax=Tribonema minus TaxID=303371 RepID=A0A836CGI5_9STRA|nr:hypothetical protein JKP88DRAFT_255168 [Tribonema minus]